nr:MAG TPA: hypothetical protein [Caudoviricetes sp.]
MCSRVSLVVSTLCSICSSLIIGKNTPQNYNIT